MAGPISIVKMVEEAKAGQEGMLFITKIERGSKGGTEVGPLSIVKIGRGNKGATEAGSFSTANKLEWTTHPIWLV